MADFWSISRIGIGSTLGLIGLVSLPRGFVFRPSRDDPHPMPWVRVLLSCAIGDRLYPDPQWDRLAATWRAMYPIAGIRPQLTAIISELRATMPELVSLLVGHRPARLRGRSLGEVLRNPELEREALLRRFSRWEADPSRMALAPPTVAFAVLGQARASGRLSPERESRLLRRLIASWAVRSSLETARATTRSDTPMFVGQPTIWADPSDWADPPDQSSALARQADRRNDDVQHQRPWPGRRSGYPRQRPAHADRRRRDRAADGRDTARGQVHGRVDRAGTRAAVGARHPHRAAGRHHRHRGSADPRQIGGRLGSWPPWTPVRWPSAPGRSPSS